jgi:2,3-bisphosphoglycerate-independent phosphoglycerate mutase
MKALFIVIDGLGDRPIKELGNKTPLEAAHTPNLDSLASKGQCGMMQPLSKKIAPESDSAVLSILGYNPLRYKTERGPFEALGAGMRFIPGMLALRCNFASTTNGVDLIDRRSGRTLTKKDGRVLAMLINRNVKLKHATFKFKHTLGHRGVLIIKSEKHLSDRISNTDPAYKKRTTISTAEAKFKLKIKKCRALTKKAKFSASLINDFTKQSFEVLNKAWTNKKRRAKTLLSANIILCRDAGNSYPNLLGISRKYNRKSAIIADTPLEIGIGKLCGLKVIKFPFLSFSKLDYGLRAGKVMRNMITYDFLYIHLKAPDIYGHDGFFQGKKESIEHIDKHFFGHLLKGPHLDETAFLVTADHSTPCKLKAHSSDPVPLLLYSKKIKKDKVTKFSESACKKGSLKLVKGLDVLELLMNASKDT